MRRTFFICILLTFVAGPTILIAGNPDELPKLDRTDPRYLDVLTGGPPGATPAKTDSIYLLGGPGAWDGRFEDSSGNPAWNSWTSVDITTPTDHWHTDTYMAENLDPLTVLNHAWWCGRYWQHDCGTGDYAGYGNNWRETLNWTGTVADNSVATDIVVTGVMNYDTESGYDRLYLEYESPVYGWTVQAVYDGTNTGLAFSIPFTVLPGEYTGSNGDEVHLRWRFVSDGGWSDEDCLRPTHGAAQIDLIEVLFDDSPQGPVEDCEGPTRWVPTLDEEGTVGNFAQIWLMLNEVDDCLDNHTPQVAFIDDGVVVPDTGGYPCLSWCYGPGGHIVNPEGGLAGTDYHIHNEIWSPALPWPHPGYDGAVFSFDVYRHELLSGDFPGMFYFWHVRSTDTGNPSDLDTAAWRDRNFVYYGGPHYTRQHEDITNLLVPGRTHVQVALGVRELGWIWGLSGTDGTPAPYFDNVDLSIHPIVGPSITARDIDLAQDSFPEIGIVNYGAPGDNSVRFDMAINTSAPSTGQITPGDSIVCTITAARAGSQLIDRPRLFYRLHPNPLFDSYRTSGYPNEGWIYGDTCRTTPGWPVHTRFWFDLPDTGFFFPGDVIHYYFQAQDNYGDETLLPADTTGFAHFGGGSGYDEVFVVRALPTLFSLGTGDQPRILLINDSAGRGGENEWMFALNNLGFQAGMGYDVYRVNGPSSAESNGIGGRATPAQLLEYETILYTCGDLRSVTISNGYPHVDAGDDVGVLDTWLQAGNKNMLLTGDNLVTDMSQSGAATAAFLGTWMGIAFKAEDVSPLIAGQNTPTVLPLPGNPVFTGSFEWIADGGCPFINRFDAVDTLTTAVRLAEFAGPGGGPGGFIESAATLASNPLGLDNQIISLPYDLMYVATPASKAPIPSAARTRMLEEILYYFGYTGGPEPPSGVPDLNLSHASAAASEVSVYSLPSGSGCPLSSCFAYGPFRVDATITLTLLDGSMAPVVNYPQEDLWLETELGGLISCPISTAADRDTDEFGMTTFSGPIAGGGYSDMDASEGTRVVVSGEPLAQPPLPIYFNSGDLNGDLAVNLMDIAMFAADYESTYTYRSDFFWDGQLDIIDFMYLAFSLQHSCDYHADPVVEVVSGPLPGGTMGVYFDQEGTESTKVVEPGVPFSAYVVLIPESVTTVAGAAWKIALPSGMVLVDFDAGDEYIDHPTIGIEHYIGECRPGMPGTPMLLASLVLFPMVGVEEGEIAMLADPDYGAPVYASCDSRYAETVGLSAHILLPTTAGTVVIDPEPDILAAPWDLAGPGGPWTGNGDSTMADMSPGNYILTWGDVPCWITPSPNPRMQTLASGGSITFGGTYQEQGTIVIDASPDAANAPWDLTGDLGFTLASSGDTTLTCMTPDDYTLTWGDIPCWITPSPNPQMQTLASGGSITFGGTYLEQGTIVIDASPDAADAPWDLVGDLGFTLTSSGDTTLTCMTPDDYTLTWGDIPCWDTPSPNPDVQVLSAGGTLAFTGTYQELGTIVIDARPDAANAPWDLTGDLGFSLSSNGDTTLVCMIPDAYTVTWGDVPGWFLPSPNPVTLALGYADTVTFVGDYGDPRPNILSITDVANDQGRNLRLIWERSLYDAPSDTVDIAGYEVYRRQDLYKEDLGPRAGDDADDNASRLDGWDFLIEVPAHGDSIYQYVAPTLCDSTLAGICWSVFFIRTTTPDPFVFYDTAPDSAYSIDNLFPGVPKNLLVAYTAWGNDLSWGETGDPDVQYYNIYRGDQPDCLFPGDEPLVSVSATSWRDDLIGTSGHAWEYCYFVTAVDFAGNEGEPTIWDQAEQVGVEDSLLPSRFVLHPTYPNPFNPLVTVRFDVPRTSRVRLQVYDLSGRLVRMLLDEHALEPGRHDVTWNGRDDSGRVVAAGSYFCRLQAGAFQQTVRMVLVK